jgi:quercetin dioxygenase-like cupin family protein
MSADDRLRTHPSDRLATAVQRVDLAAAAATLRAEPHAPVAGHRQLAVVRHGPVSMILFAFEKDGHLKEHDADGEVIIHVLKGRLTVTLATEEVTLGAGQLLALAPGQRHAVSAAEASDMLLCIARQPAAAAV